MIELSLPLPIETSRLEGHLIENEWVKDEWQSELVYALLAREWRARTEAAG